VTEPRNTLGALAGFAALVIACALLLASVASVTGPQIEANRERQLSAALAAVAGRDLAASDLTWRYDVAVLCGPVAVLRGASPGYAGEIRWLAAAQPAEAGVVLRGVRIVAHQETPGIADFLNRPDHGWLLGLHGLDGATLAVADTVSGATVTTRALRHDSAHAIERAATALAETAHDPECEP
jgi:Na+-translocating ferredoxin:NAD+ oxidoreductase RnfG subunit